MLTEAQITRLLLASRTHPCLPLIVVLTRIDCLIMQKSKELEESTRKQRPDQRPNPVYPMVAGEAPVDDVRA